MKEQAHYQICENCVMDTSDSGIIFDENGICDYCLNFSKKYTKFFFSWKK